MDLIGANIILHDVDETYMKRDNKHLWLQSKMILYIFTPQRPFHLFMLHFIPAGHQCFLTGFQFKCKTLYFHMHIYILQINCFRWPASFKQPKQLKGDKSNLSN